MGWGARCEQNGTSSHTSGSRSGREICMSRLAAEEGRGDLSSLEKNSWIRPEDTLETDCFL